MTDPWERKVEKLTPEQYARFLVQRAANSARASAVRIHMENSGLFLEKAAAYEAWLLNGVTALSEQQIDYLLEALVLPEPNSPVDPLETETDRRNRRVYINGLRAGLMTAKGKR